MIKKYIFHMSEHVWTACVVNYSSSSVAAFIHSFIFGREKIEEEPSAVPHEDQVGD